MYIALGKSRRELNWKNKELSWQDFLGKISETYTTRETHAEFVKMSKLQQSNIKDIGGFVGGKLKEGRRLDTNVLSRSLLTLDLDYAPIGFWDVYTMLFDFETCIYSTHSHTPNKPRLRLIVPLSREVSPDEYQAISRKLAEEVGIDYFDDTTYQPSRLMFWPSTSKGAEYIYEHQEGPTLDADTYLNKYDDWTDISFWPMSSRVDKIHQKTADKQGDPIAKEGLIGAFCRTYTITDAIDTFLSDIYVECADSKRYTYVHGSSAAGVVIYDDKFSYSNHSTDPTSMQLCNAYDLVRIHKFGELDVDMVEGSKKRPPSESAMNDFVREDTETQKTLIQEEWQDVNDTEEELPEEDLDWLLQLERHHKTNDILSTIQNVEIILRNDHQLKKVFAYNDFSKRPIAVRDLPWRKVTNLTADLKDSDDSAIRAYLEKYYHISGRGIIEDAVVNITNENSFHPIKNYINTAKWDGVNRVEELLINYLGAEDTPYVRAVTRKTLCAAVARVFRPGIKFDTMLVLIGGQGLGKTTLFERLGNDWFSNSMPTFKGKDAMEALQGVWILEVGELAAMKKAESEEVKNLLSKTKDQFRVAYGRRTEVFQRQCILVGTTNKKEIFRDTTGNRRFWPVDCIKDEDKKQKFFSEFTSELVEQIWAEAKILWEKGEQLYLSYEMEEEAMRVQEEHKEVDIRVEPIVRYLDTLLPEDWEEMTLDERRWFLNGEDSTRVGTIKRTRVCVLEIVQEVFQHNTNNLDNYKAKEYNDILHSLDEWEYKNNMRPLKPYKRGRGFVRKLSTKN